MSCGLIPRVMKNFAWSGLNTTYPMKNAKRTSAAMNMAQKIRKKSLIFAGFFGFFGVCGLLPVAHGASCAGRTGPGSSPWMAVFIISVSKEGGVLLFSSSVFSCPVIILKLKKGVPCSVPEMDMDGR